MCPACRNTARIRRSYSVVVTAVAAVAAGLLAYALGARGGVLIASIFIGVYPISFLIGLVSVQLFAPDLEATGEFRAILYGESGETPVALSDEDQHRLRVGRILINALALLAFVGLLVGAAGLFRLERWVYNAAPVLSTRSGPKGFPVTIRIQEDGLDFTNGSSGPWTCSASIGINETRSPTFTVEAMQKSFVGYDRFIDGTLALSADDGYWRAREKIIVECLDRAGLSHFAAF